MSLTPGSALGPYLIEAPIGAGGMGEVYRVRDTRLDRTVAIKILSGELADAGHARKRFEREARVIAALEYPHICPLYDVGEHHGVSFLVMQHLHGETLAERLKRGALPVDQAIHYAAEMAGALAAGKRHGHQERREAARLRTGADRRVARKPTTWHRGTSCTRVREPFTP
jgi:eukaryotic-like serine/threonine-protein kinase